MFLNKILFSGGATERTKAAPLGAQGTRFPTAPSLDAEYPRIVRTDPPDPHYPRREKDTPTFSEGWIFKLPFTCVLVYVSLWSDGSIVEFWMWHSSWDFDIGGL